MDPGSSMVFEFGRGGGTIGVSVEDATYSDRDEEDKEEFEAAVELDESLLNYPATGVDSIVTNNAQFLSRAKPKKAFSIMKFKKRLNKDTSLLFDEKP